MKIKRLMVTLLALPVLLLGPIGCQTMQEHKIATGSAIGAGAGALLGGVIGHQSGHTEGGALIGAATGALLGGGVGYILDRQAKQFQAIRDLQVEKVPAGPEVVAPPPAPNAPPVQEQRPEHLTLKMQSEMLFQRGSSALTPEGTQKLAQIADTLRQYPDSDVIVKGYTSIEGGDALNMNLSQARASVVKNTLVAYRVAPERITAIGMGSSNPIANNDSEVGRMQNRRVEIDVFPRGEVR